MLLTKSACCRRACVNVVEMTPAALPSPVSLVYLITAVRALAQFHQPVSRHRPEDGS